MDTRDKVRVAETTISALVKHHAALGRTLAVDNAVAAFVGTRANNEPGGPDVDKAVNEYVTAPLSSAILEYEVAGKKARSIRLFVQEDHIEISIE